MLFCPHCGADRRAVAPIAACPGCGVKLDVDQLQLGVPPTTTGARFAANTEEVEIPPRGSRKGLFVAGGLAAAVVATVVFIVMSGGGSANPGTPAAGAVASAAAAAPPAPPPPQMPKRIVLRIERVQVAVGGREWDGPVAEVSYKKICQDLASAVASVKPVAALGGLACDLLGNSKQRQSDPREPDLRIELRSGPVIYTSYVAPDRRAHQFGYSFVIPDESIPTQGLVLAVLDDDDGAMGGEEISSIRLSRDQLIALATTSDVASLSAEALNLLEITVTPHDGKLRKVEFDLATNSGGETVRGIAVNAGDVVRIEASGTWQIGTYNNELLGPDGFTDGRLHSSNLPLFPSAAHGSTVALVGQQGELLALPVQPCVRVVSAFAGVIWVGINDRKFSDNVGSARIRVFTRAPKPAEWASPKALLGCD